MNVPSPLERIHFLNKVRV